MLELAKREVKVERDLRKFSNLSTRVIDGHIDLPKQKVALTITKTTAIRTPQVCTFNKQ